mmetsp:Transcript_4953/g.10569  ORF Transcript_4953/g.10569 Transcript_4953/m.10569 type:complete len:166 (+) Transcript_4953:2442-2939(+)
MLFFWNAVYMLWNQGTTIPRASDTLLERHLKHSKTSLSDINRQGGFAQEQKGGKGMPVFLPLVPSIRETKNGWQPKECVMGVQDGVAVLFFIRLRKELYRLTSFLFFYLSVLFFFFSLFLLFLLFLSFVPFLWTSCSEFSTWKQSDSHEYFHTIMDSKEPSVLPL